MVKQPLHLVAIVMFLVCGGATLGSTYWAAKRIHSPKDFYAAGGDISGLQNGFAIAGDYMAVASFLGISGLVVVIGLVTAVLCMILGPTIWVDILANE